MSLRAEGEAITFLRLLRSLSLPRNDKLLNAFVLVIERAVSLARLEYLPVVLVLPFALLQAAFAL